MPRPACPACPAVQVQLCKNGRRLPNGPSAVNPWNLGRSLCIRRPYRIAALHLHASCHPITDRVLSRVASSRVGTGEGRCIEDSVTLRQPRASQPLYSIIHPGPIDSPAHPVDTCLPATLPCTQRRVATSRCVEVGGKLITQGGFTSCSKQTIYIHEHMNRWVASSTNNRQDRQDRQDRVGGTPSCFFFPCQLTGILLNYLEFGNRDDGLKVY